MKPIVLKLYFILATPLVELTGFSERIGVAKVSQSIAQSHTQIRWTKGRDI